MVLIEFNGVDKSLSVYEGSVNNEFDVHVGIWLLWIIGH